MGFGSFVSSVGSSIASAVAPVTSVAEQVVMAAPNVAFSAVEETGLNEVANSVTGGTYGSIADFSQSSGFSNTLNNLLQGESVRKEFQLAQQIAAQAGGVPQGGYNFDDFDFNDYMPDFKLDGNSIYDSISGLFGKENNQSAQTSNGSPVSTIGGYNFSPPSDQSILLLAAAGLAAFLIFRRM